METTPPRGLSLTLSFVGDGRRSVHLPLGPALRVAAALALCALSYKLGVWRERLELAAREDLVAKVAAAPRPARGAQATPVSAPAALEAPGGPVGETADVITPLNVRDPSALVMAPPGIQEQAAPPPAAPKPQPRLFPKPGEHTGPEIRGRSQDLRL